MLKIIIVESHIIILDHLKALLSDQTAFKVVEVVSSGNGLVELLLSGVSVDLVMAGLYKTKGNNLEWLLEAKRLRPGLPILVISNVAIATQIREVFLAGASGYLLSNIGRDELFFCIRHTTLGGEYISSQLAVRAFKEQFFSPQQNFLNETGHYSVTEVRLLQAISDGLSSQEIADTFFLSRRSIESRRAALLVKAGVSNTASLIKFAALNGLVN